MCVVISKMKVNRKPREYAVSKTLFLFLAAAYPRGFNTSLNKQKNKRKNENRSRSKRKNMQQQTKTKVKHTVRVGNHQEG